MWGLTTRRFFPESFSAIPSAASARCSTPTCRPSRTRTWPPGSWRAASARRASTCLGWSQAWPTRSRRRPIRESRLTFLFQGWYFFQIPTKPSGSLRQGTRLKRPVPRPYIEGTTLLWVPLQQADIFLVPEFKPMTFGLTSFCLAPGFKLSTLQRMTSYLAIITFHKDLHLSSLSLCPYWSTYWSGGLKSCH